MTASNRTQTLISFVDQGCSTIALGSFVQIGLFDSKPSQTHLGYPVLQTGKVAKELS
jgi:hypothetical protein